MPKGFNQSHLNPHSWANHSASVVYIHCCQFHVFPGFATVYSILTVKPKVSSHRPYEETDHLSWNTKEVHKPIFGNNMHRFLIKDL